jgi:hypothetical protein
MATSINRAFIRVTAGQASENDPCDAIIARDCIMNNAAHLADEAAQVRVKWLARTAATSGVASDEYLTARAADGAAYDWGHVVTFGPFPLSVRADLYSYYMRVRLRGYYSGSSSTAYVALTFPGYTFNPTNSNVAEFSLASTTDGWVTPVGSNILRLIPSEVARATGAFSAKDSVGGAETATAICWASIGVYATAASGTADVARITGIEAAEYVGV